jgi:hypothetical protein
MKLISHGVNIKMEKTGGPINALRAFIGAKEQKMDIMFGSMVSTQLGCTQIFQFHPLAQYFDIDGALLVSSPQI